MRCVRGVINAMRRWNHCCGRVFDENRIVVFVVALAGKVLVLSATVSENAHFPLDNITHKFKLARFFRRQIAPIRLALVVRDDFRRRRNKLAHRSENKKN
jgi:hypothetical protein